MTVYFFFLYTTPIRRDSEITKKFGKEFKRRMQIATSNKMLKQYMNKSGFKRMNKQFSDIIQLVKK